MNANDRFFARDAQVDHAAVQPFPNSRRSRRGSRPDIRVPMREITQADTPASFGVEKNPPIVVYDTSACHRSRRRHRRKAAFRPPARWIEERRHHRARQPDVRLWGRLADAALAGMRFDLKRKPRRARPG
jgi:phosphomethylpyrimidine synthase